MQNCSARLVAKQPRAAHISPVLKVLHWLPVEQRITFQVLLSRFLVHFNPTRSLRSAEKYLVEAPKVRDV
mgnify:CR=1 FL=1